jgi:hypothetical protein
MSDLLFKILSLIFETLFRGRGSVHITILYHPFSVAVAVLFELVKFTSPSAALEGSKTQETTLAQSERHKIVSEGKIVPILAKFASGSKSFDPLKHQYIDFESKMSSNFS